MKKIQWCEVRRSRSFIRAQREAIDVLLDPGFLEVFKVKEEQENGSQLKSLHFANIERKCSEISSHRPSRSLSHDNYKPDNQAICVKGEGWRISGERTTGRSKW